MVRGKQKTVVASADKCRGQFIRGSVPSFLLSLRFRTHVPFLFLSTTTNFHFERFLNLHASHCPSQHFLKTHVFPYNFVSADFGPEACSYRGYGLRYIHHVTASASISGLAATIHDQHVLPIIGRYELVETKT